jgi:hypothetical protein
MEGQSVFDKKTYLAPFFPVELRELAIQSQEVLE